MLASLLLALLSSGIAAAAPPAAAPASAPASSIEGLREIPPPDAELLRCAAYSKVAWEVTATGGRLRAARAGAKASDPLPPALAAREKELGRGRRHVLDVGDGWLVGTDAGEWGGALFWASRDGATLRSLSDKNVRGLARVGDKVLVASGLAHLGSDTGAVRLLRRSAAGQWEVAATLDLGTAPQAIAADGAHAMVLAGSTGIFRATDEPELTRLAEAPLRGLYPGSVAVAGGTLAVGMRNFVVTLSPADARLHWYVAAECARFELRKYDCDCVER